MNVFALAHADIAHQQAEQYLDRGRAHATAARDELQTLRGEAAEPGEQLALLAPAAKEKPLTDRQQAVLTALQAAAQDGLDTDQAGAIAHELKTGRWAHGRDDRCAYCGRDGKAILKRLGDLGHCRYRRANRARSIPGAWLATNIETTQAPERAGMLADDEPIPF